MDDRILVRVFDGPRPPIVCLCGTRFVDEFNRQRHALTEAGAIVLAIEVVTTQTREHDPRHVNPALKARLDELHKRKIDLADHVLVLNVDGYIGDSTPARRPEVMVRSASVWGVDLHPRYPRHGPRRGRHNRSSSPASSGSDAT